jgi:hypothetical protein
MSETEILKKYMNYLVYIESLDEKEIEELIFYLENEVLENGFKHDCLIANYIKLLRRIELNMKLSEYEEICVEQLKIGKIEDIKYENHVKKILKKINK